MSRKDEIIVDERDLNFNYRIVGIMDKYKRAIDDEYGLVESDYETVATEIAALFEVEGKKEIISTKKVLRYSVGKEWYDYSLLPTEVNLDIEKVKDNAIIRCKGTRYKFRIVFRVTTDQIIE